MCPILGLCSFDLLELLEAFHSSGVLATVWSSEDPKVTPQVLKPKSVSLASPPGASPLFTPPGNAAASSPEDKVGASPLHPWLPPLPLL